MRVLIITDRAFISREHAMLRRLEVGLMDEGIRLMRCVPEGCESLMPSGLIPQATYSETGPALTLPWRAHRVLRELSALDPETSRIGATTGPFDAVHAWGPRNWSLAVELALESEADLILEVFCEADISAARAFERRHIDEFDEEVRALWAVPDEPMFRALERAGTKWPVRILPWGVYVPESSRPLRRPGEPACICICGSGADTRSVQALLEGVHAYSTHGRRLEGSGAGSLPELLLFLDDGITRAAPAIWKTAEKLGLLDRTSVIPDMEGRREPVLRAELLALPEGGGFHRSIMLDAMAAGIPVLMPEDDLIEDAIEGQTAVIVRSTTRLGWAESLERVLGDLDAAIHLGESARQHVATHRLASSQVKALLELYQQLSGSPLTFRS